MTQMRTMARLLRGRPAKPRRSPTARWAGRPDSSRGPFGSIRAGKQARFAPAPVLFGAAAAPLVGANPPLLCRLPQMRLLLSTAPPPPHHHQHPSPPCLPPRRRKVLLAAPARLPTPGLPGRAMPVGGPPPRRAPNRSPSALEGSPLRLPQRKEEREIESGRARDNHTDEIVTRTRH